MQLYDALLLIFVPDKQTQPTMDNTFDLIFDHPGRLERATKTLEKYGFKFTLVPTSTSAILLGVIAPIQGSTNYGILPAMLSHLRPLAAKDYEPEYFFIEEVESTGERLRRTFGSLLEAVGAMRDLPYSSAIRCTTDSSVYCP